MKAVELVRIDFTTALNNRFGNQNNQQQNQNNNQVLNNPCLQSNQLSCRM